MQRTRECLPLLPVSFVLHAILDDMNHVLKGGHMSQGITIHDDYVGQLPGFDGTQFASFAIQERGSTSGRADYLQRRNTVAHHELHLLAGGLAVKVHWSAGIGSDDEPYTAII